MIRISRILPVSQYGEYTIPDVPFPLPSIAQQAKNNPFGRTKQGILGLDRGGQSSGSIVTTDGWHHEGRAAREGRKEENSGGSEPHWSPVERLVLGFLLVYY